MVGKELFYTNLIEAKERIGSVARYECMECGTIFYGNWHSKWSWCVIERPTCKGDTDLGMVVCRDALFEG